MYLPSFDSSYDVESNENHVCLHTSISKEPQEVADEDPHEVNALCEVKEPNSQPDRCAYKLIKNTVKFVGGRFQLSLLGKDKSAKFPSN